MTRQGSQKVTLEKVISTPRFTKTSVKWDPGERDPQDKAAIPNWNPGPLFPSPAPSGPSGPTIHSLSISSFMTFLFLGHKRAQALNRFIIPDTECVIAAALRSGTLPHPPAASATVVLRGTHGTAPPVPLSPASHLDERHIWPTLIEQTPCGALYTHEIIRS